jgi:hypothetical protein
MKWKLAYDDGLVPFALKHKQYEWFVIIRLKLRNDTHILFLSVNAILSNF